MNGKKAKALRRNVSVVSYMKKRVTNTKTNTALFQILLDQDCDRRVYKALKRMVKQGVSHV